MGEWTLGVGSGAGVGSTLAVGLATRVRSANGEGNTAGVGMTAGVRMDEAGVKGSGCPEGPGCSEGPENIGFLGVGLGMSSVFIVSRCLFLAHSSKMCINAHQTAFSQHWQCKHSLHLRLAPLVYAPQNGALMANRKTTSSVSVQ